jgi:DNA polymerase
MDTASLLRDVEERCRAASLPLKEGAQHLVFGKGNPAARIVFIGEAPGANEDAQGMPFVGAAGKNLDKLLAGAGLSLDDVYIANVLKYRPPENRNPLPEEITAHAPWLLEQLRVIRPTVVCSLGNFATKLVLAQFAVMQMETIEGITALHGKIYPFVWEELSFQLIPLFHPAAIIYNRKLLPLWENDMTIVKQVIGTL